MRSTIPQSIRFLIASTGCFLLTFALLFLSSCGGDGGKSPPEPPAQPVVGSIEITPAGILFTKAGESIQLAVRVLDQNGNELQEPVTCKSLNETIITVTPEGLATAVSDLGSAQIIAEAKGVQSAPLLALVAQPVAGAILITDLQVVEGPVPLDLNTPTPYGVGWKYKVVLAGISKLDPGSILLCVEEMPIGGRVVEAKENNGEVELVLEVVSPGEMFEKLVVNETISLANVPVFLMPQAEQYYTLGRLPDGTIQIDPINKQQSGQSTGRMAPDLKFNLLGFDCEVIGEANPFEYTFTERSFKFKLDYKIDYDSEDGGLKVLAVVGSVESIVKGSIKISASLEVKLECKAELFTPSIPLNGPLALIFSPKVPLGVGFTLAGKINGPSFEYKIDKTNKCEMQLGIYCQDGACEPYKDIKTTKINNSHWQFPNSGWDAARVELGLFIYGLAKLEIGPPEKVKAILRKLTSWIVKVDWEKVDIELLKAKFGIKLYLDLAHGKSQVSDPEYHSKFGQKPVVELEAELTWKAIEGLLDVKFASFKYAPEFEDWDSSPKGKFTVVPDKVKVHDPANPDRAKFTVELDPVKFQGDYMVKDIHILWKKMNEDGSYELKPAPGVCAIMFPGEGEEPTAFTCETSFGPEYIGIQDFYAFVLAEMYGVEIPVFLEINNDAKATLQIGDIPVDFVDANLEGAVLKKLGKDSPPVYVSEMENLLTLYATNAGITSVSGLEYAKYLMELNLGGNLISDLTPLQSLGELDTLNLWGNPVTDLKPISNLTNLRRLELGETGIKDLSPLAGLVNLTNLGLVKNDLENSNIVPLENLTNLSWLVLAENHLSDISPLKNMTNLVFLNLGYNDIVDISPLMDLVNLTRLHLYHNDIVDISPLQNMAKLTNLYLYNNQINSTSGLRDLKELVELALENNLLTETSELSDHPKLIYLNLNNNDIADAGGLQNLDSLEQLWMQNNEVVNLSGVSNIPKLRWLFLDNNKITDSAPFAQWKDTLEILILSNNELANATGFTGLEKLTSLTLDGNQILDSTGLENLLGLTELKLNGNPMTKLVLKNLPLVPFIDVSNGSLQSVEITNMPALQSLYLYDNDIIDISGMEGGNLASLDYLRLNNNNIADIGALGNAGLTSLLELELNNNSIVSITALSGLAELSKLDLSSNNITDIQALVDNAGLGSGDTVNLIQNSLDTNCDPAQGDTTDCENIGKLKSRGVNVYWDGP